MKVGVRIQIVGQPAIQLSDEETLELDQRLRAKGLLETSKELNEAVAGQRVATIPESELAAVVDLLREWSLEGSPDRFGLTMSTLLASLGRSVE